MDYFKNSLFIDRKICDEINQELTNYFIELNNYINEFNIATNIYLTGSLSRREPSIEYIYGKYRLASDIDFIFVVENEKDREKYYQMSITKLLNQKFSIFKNSVVILSKEEIINVNSRIGKNLFMGSKYPVRQDFEVVWGDCPEVDRWDYLEAAINIMILIMTFPKKLKESLLFKANESYYEAKLITEAMKMLKKSEKNKEIVDNFHHFSECLSMKEVLMLIKSRELNNEVAPDFEKNIFLKKIIAKTFNSKSCEDFISEEYDAQQSYLKDCQFIFLILYLYPNGSRQDSLDEILKKLYEKVGLPSNFSKKELIKLRIDYMMSLHYRNTKSRGNSLPDLKEVSLS